MRWVLALTVSFAAGCTDGTAPPILANDDIGVGDLSEEDMAADAGTVDLAGNNGDQSPQGCRTACDCPSGQACINNACTTAQQVFCCGTAACVGADTCQAPDGRISQCAAPADAGIRPDAGMPSACAATACTPGLGSQLFCSLACGTLTAMCSGATGHCTP